MRAALVGFCEHCHLIILKSIYFSTFSHKFREASHEICYLHSLPQTSSATKIKHQRVLQPTCRVSRRRSHSLPHHAGFTTSARAPTDSESIHEACPAQMNGVIPPESSTGPAVKPVTCDRLLLYTLAFPRLGFVFLTYFSLFIYADHRCLLLFIYLSYCHS